MIIVSKEPAWSHLVDPLPLSITYIRLHFIRSPVITTIHFSLRLTQEN